MPPMGRKPTPRRSGAMLSPSSSSRPGSAPNTGGRRKDLIRSTLARPVRVGGQPGVTSAASTNGAAGAARGDSVKMKPSAVAVQAMHQTLELLCVRSGLVASVQQPQFLHDRLAAKWRYQRQAEQKPAARGERRNFEVHITSAVEDGDALVVLADGHLYAGPLHAFHARGLKVRIEPGAAPDSSPAAASAESAASIPTSTST